jgi:hypothetical protein
MFTKFLALSLAVVPSALAQWMVIERNGRIAVEDPQGDIRELTDSGRDFGPWISCDQKTVLFVRGSPEDPFTTAIYAIDLPSKELHLLFDGSIAYSGGQTHYISEPQLGLDNDILYVLARYDMSTGGVFAIDLRSRKIEHIADGAAFILIRSGKYAGDFLVNERKVSIVGGIYYVYRLYSAEGKDLGLAGPGNMDIASFDCNRAAVEKAQRRASAAVPANAPAAARRDLLVPAKAMEARLESRVQPAQTVPADAAAVDRVVHLSITISKEGKVTDTQLVSGPPNLVPVAISAVRQWRYKPYEVNGKPVQVVTDVDVQFAAKQ